MLKETPTLKQLTSPRNLYAGQESTVRIERGTIDWFQIGGKESRLSSATLLITSKERLDSIKLKLESR